jgi:hypothetical protein
MLQGLESGVENEGENNSTCLFGRSELIAGPDPSASMGRLFRNDGEE